MGKDLSKVGKIVFMCSGYTCQKRGADGNILVLRKCIEDQALKEQVHTIKTLCTGQCESGPIMFLYPDGVWYREIDESRAERIITSHILQGQLLDNILYKDEEAEQESLEIGARDTNI